MDYSLTDDEIRILKQLKGAGVHGRPIPHAPLLLARLMKAAYVKRRVSQERADRYVITDRGAAALSDTMV